MATAKHTDTQVQTLEIKNLHVEVEGTEILHGIDLRFESNKVHAIMGPNGSGKSTLANTIMGHPSYTITKGKILLNGEDITNASADQRAKKGLFLSFQYPLEVPGVNINTFLRTAVNAKREYQGLTPYTIPQFFKILKEKMAVLNLDASFRKRSLNDGFSGGEKKRSEMLQLLLLNPLFAILDETDSGLDVDGIKAVADAIKAAKQQSLDADGKENPMGIVLITHYERFIKELAPDKVSILCNGKIIKEGSTKLAQKIHDKGFEQFIK